MSTDSEAREKEVQTLRSGAVSAEPPAWQPIETAPQDGTRILGYIERDGHQWRVVIRALEQWDGWYTDPGKHHVRPTHWMPLPQPPSAALRAEPRETPDTETP